MSKKKPKLLLRFKLLLLQKGGFSHCWYGQRLVVGYQGYQMTFSVEGGFVQVIVFGSYLHFLFPVDDEFVLFERCDRHNLFNFLTLKKFDVLYHEDVLSRVGARRAV